MASPLDNLTDDELRRLMALPEAERATILNNLAAAPPPDIAMGAPEPETEWANDPRLDPERISFRGASSMATSEPQRQQMTPLERGVTEAGLAEATLGPIGQGIGAIGGIALRAAKPLAAKAAAPIARGVVQAAGDVIERGLPITTSVIRGTVAAIKPEAKKMLQSKVEHALARGLKEAGKPVEEAVVKSTAKSLRDELPEFIVSLAKRPEHGGQGFTRPQIVNALKDKYGSASFSEGAAGKIVDDVAKLFDIELVTTPGAAAKAAGQTFNQTVRAARAKVGAQ